MARPLRVQFPGACYHVTCRGNERRAIFLNDEDRQEFLDLLEVSVETYQAVLHAYVLMANHFHLLVQTPAANLSEFMRNFNIRYTTRFNSRHRRCGHLYQGRYKAFLIDVDSYLLEVSRYVHLNSIRVRGLRRESATRLWRQLAGYRWSSLPGYLEQGRAMDFVSHATVLALAGGRRRYGDYVREGLRPETRSPFADLKLGLVLGDGDFVARLRRKHTITGSKREQPSLRHLVEQHADVDVIMNLTAEATGVSREKLQVRQGDGTARGIAAEMLHRHGGLSQPEIGQVLGGIDYSAVSRLRSRLQQRVRRDQAARDPYRQADKKLKALLSRVKI